MSRKPTKTERITQLLCLSLILLMANCQTDEIVTNKTTPENTTQKATTIKKVSIDMIPEIKEELEEVKKIKKSNSTEKKSISDFKLDEKNIVELIKDNGDKTYSFVIENELSENESYSVENLNIMVRNAEFQSFITKWIPSDGKPFYNIKKFEGEVQYLDLEGNIQQSFNLPFANTNKTSKTTLQYAFTLGCYSYVIADFGSGWFIYSSREICGGSGDGTSSGGTSGTGSSTGSGSSSGGTTSGNETSGGGGSTTSSTTSFVPNIPTEDEVERKMYNTFLTSLTKDQYNFLGYYTNVNQDIFNYLADNNFASAYKLVAKKMINAAFISYTLGTNASIEFVEWGSNYLIQNPTVTYLKFQNWFMGTSEGQDGDYDAAYWENPNLTFKKQNLPTYNDYYNGMARFADGKLMTGADNVYGLVGGAVHQARINNPTRTANTCALKVSIALNRAEVIIPSLPGKTLEGSGEFAGKYFFLNARSLNSWMRETFGTNPATTTTPSNENHRSYTAADGGLNGADFPDKLKGINAIYSMITTEEYYKQSQTSGHSDLLFTDNNGLGECVYKCFFNLPIQRIDL